MNGDYVLHHPLRHNLISYKRLHNRHVSSAGNIQTEYGLLKKIKNQTQYCVAYFVFIMLMTIWWKRNLKDEWCWIDMFCASHDALTLLTWFDEIFF